MTDNDSTDNDSAMAICDRPSVSVARPQTNRKPKRQPPYNVVLLDDDDHSYDYVISMLGRLFGHKLEDAYLMACEVDSTGRVIVDTTTFERAELKRDQIHAFGRDRQIDRCKGCMSAVIEPCPS
ncbi:MAG: ATP-dependent Clp protease adaptor ClpS [Planctomycetes bacterium]|nr:ATP-dependent Clp protease adaptor ClpS [Planctomycetota bacterium]